jgi:hypothetical protein
LGDKRVHLLKLVGAFFIAGGLLKLAEASYQIFLTVRMAQLATSNSALIGGFFKWGLNCSTLQESCFGLEDTIGVMVGPMANFMFWFAMLLLAFMVYQSGKVFLPVEEYEQKVEEHHADLIRKATEHYRKMQQKPAKK